MNDSPQKVKDEYEDGVCPDCGKEIPDAAKHEESCSECGHVWNPPSNVDD